MQSDSFQTALKPRPLIWNWCECEQDTEKEGKGLWKVLVESNVFFLAKRKLRGVKVEAWLVASVQIRRLLQFLCWDGSHNLQTYCCYVPPLFTHLPPPLLPPTCPSPPLLLHQPKHNWPWLPATSGLHWCVSQQLLKWTGWPINRTEWLLKRKTPLLSPFLSHTMASHSHIHIHTHAHSSNFEGRW